MGRELGRISGPLLAENLLRNGNNLAFDSKLIYLDVVNGYIGINTDTPTRHLLVDGTLDTTNLIVDTSATIADLEFTTDQIQNVTGGITFTPFQSANPIVTAPKFKVSNIEFTNNSISNLTNNANIVLDPNGSGKVIFNTSKVNVTGSLHATGDITWDGSITLGDNNLDNVTFNADVNSKIVPDADNTYDIGASGKEWRNLYGHDLKTTALTSTNLTVNNINLLLTQGHTIYVSVNGSDSKTGTHLHDSYLTIKKALSVAVAGDEIVIFPGTYTEIFPLTVPQGVSVRGMDIRNVIVKPTTGTNTNNAFLMNGETTVSFLTVKDFYAPGNAFSFASNFTVTTRSPYVQNVTVITTGPDAGNGALVDGSLANIASKEAAILFNAVTMIVPDAIGIQATNGARVEWLNGFTYFANKGIYLTEGTLGFASQHTKYGAEMRSIGSANVYGTYGAYADGPSTLGYLIGHNFGYIGSGLDSQNDYGLVEQANEVVAINGGQLYYDSTDQKGDYRIGDIFLVEQSTGNVSFNAQAITYTANGTITLEGLGGRTFIHAPAIEVGNIRIHGNNIDSMSGPVNFLAFSGSTYLNTNVTVTGNTDITGDTNIKGTLTTFGNEATDKVTVLDYLTQTIKPDLNNTYTLGKITGTEKRWNTLYATLIDVDGVTQLTNNTITTLTTDTDLRLIAAGSGIIEVTTTDVEITNNLTVVGSSDLQDVEILGTLNLPGSYTYSQTGTADRTGSTDITGHINVYGAHVVQFEDIKFDSNVIATTFGDHDLTFTADGAGIVNIINTNVQVTNNLSVDLTGYFSSVDATNVTADAYDIDSVYITGNTITTNVTDTNLVLSADGTGKIQVTTTDVVITNDLEVKQLTTLTNVGITGLLDLTGDYTWTHTGTSDRTGNTDITGSLIVNGAHTVQFEDIKFVGDLVTTTLLNSNLVLTANGLTSVVKTLLTDVEITNDLDVHATADIDTLNATTVTANAYDIGSVYITGNTITTNVLNTNLILSADGTGKIHVTTTDVVITNDLEVNQLSTLTNVGITGLLDLTGDYTWTHTGTSDRTGNTDITGSLIVNGAHTVQFEDIKFVGDLVTTTLLNSNLVLTANGLTSVVKTLLTDVEITNDLDVHATADIDTLNATTVTANAYDIGSVYITGNTITTNVLNTNLILSADGTGKIHVTTTDVVITNDLEVNQLSTLTNVDITGLLDLIGDYTWTHTGTSDRTGNTDITGSLTVNGNHYVQFQDINITNNVITTTVTNNDLILKAITPANIVNVVNTNVQVDLDLNVDLALGANSVQVTQGVTADDFYIGDFYIKNTISIVPNNTDLILGATGVVKFKDSDVNIANDITVISDVSVAGTTSLKNTVIRSETLTPTVTQVSQNLSGTTDPTGFFFYGWQILHPGQTEPTFSVIQPGWTVVGQPTWVVTVVGDGITNYGITITGGSFATGGTYSFTGDVLSYGPATLTQTGNINQTGSTYVTGDFQADSDISVTGPSSFLSVHNVKIDANIISATVTDADLSLSANGYGGVRLERYIKITDNDISNVFDSNNIELAFNNLMLAEDGQNLILETGGDYYLADTLLDGDLSVKFTPNGTGNLVINSDKAFAVAYGNTANRILKDVGEIRQNSTTQVYEGKLAVGVAKFNYVYDTDGNTYITPEATPGANDNILRFGIDGVDKVYIDSTKLFSNILQSDNVKFNGTTITNAISTSDLVFLPAGSGVVNFNNVSLIGNEIANNADSALIFENTGTGYVKFSGTNGIVFPRGPSVSPLS